MPIIINSKDVIKKMEKETEYTPKYFDSSLTGNGKGRGLVKEALNPINKEKTKLPVKHTKKKVSNSMGDLEIKIIPTSILDAYFIVRVSELPLYIPKERLCKIEDNIYLNMSPERVDIFKSKDDKTNKKETKVQVTYTVAAVVKKSSSHLYSEYNVTSISDPSIEDLENFIYKNYGIKTNDEIHKNIEEYMENYSIYDNLVYNAEECDTLASFYLMLLIDALNQTNTLDINKMKIITSFIEKIEQFNINLDKWIEVHEILQGLQIAEDLKKRIYRTDLKLQLIETLKKVRDKKDTLPTVPNHDSIKIDPRYTLSQKEAIKDPGPLVLVQAGAGTGKSTVILNRIDYMVKAGIDPKDITVISFTNAAADNIKMRNPKITSMTIASLIHKIYQENYPNHRLSSVDTIKNTLQSNIRFKSENLRNFISYLELINKEPNLAFRDISHLFEDHFDEMIGYLDAIEQTSLELEIIIANIRVNDFKEPDDISSKYIIIDEVQDNSVFEFVYLMDYVEKKNCSLFAVGDSAQTLYEFRAADPRALNIIEASGIFSTHKLEVNFRSNQSILTLSNTILYNIETNRFANIQLIANEMDTLNYENYKKSVKIDEYIKGSRIDYNDLGKQVANGSGEFIRKKIENGEKVAILGYTKKQVECIQKELKERGYKVDSIIAKRLFTTNLFSTYVRQYFGEMKLVPSKNFASNVLQHIYTKLVYITRGDIEIAEEQIVKWYEMNKNEITLKQSHVKNKNLSEEKFMEYVKETLINYEIELVKRKFKKKEDMSEKIENADVVISTIHSAKGLEFDNVVLLYDESIAEREESKRMYYVGLTRAKKSEMIYVLRTSSQQSTLQMNHTNIIKYLLNVENNKGKN